MTGLVAMINEEYVRSQWEWCKVYSSELFKGYTQGVVVVEVPEYKFSGSDETAAMSLAADFTRQRDEEIRQLKGEIEWLKLILPTALSWKVYTKLQWPQDRLRMFVKFAVRGHRVLVARESALAELTKGMKL